MLNNRGALKPHQRERTKYGGYYSILQVTTKFCIIRVFGEFWPKTFGTDKTE